MDFFWKDIAPISTLQNLEILKLQCCAFHGPLWNTCKSEFPRLKHLLLEDLELKEWTAASESFPRLRRLVIRHCYILNLIPEVGLRNDTFKYLVVDDCSTSTVEWAEQLSLKINRSRYEIVHLGITQSWNENDND